MEAIVALVAVGLSPGLQWHTTGNETVSGFTVQACPSLCMDASILFSKPKRVQKSAANYVMIEKEDVNVVSSCKTLVIRGDAVAVLARNSGAKSVLVASAPNLLVLDIAWNMLTYLRPGFLSSSPSIVYFDVSGNSMNAIGEIWGLSVPFLLNLSYLNASQVPSAVYNGASRTTVDLRGNHLRTANVNHSGYVLLDGNGIMCVAAGGRCWCENGHRIEYANGKACCRKHGCSMPEFRAIDSIVDHLLSGLATELRRGGSFGSPRLPAGRVFTGLGAQCGFNIITKNRESMSIYGKIYRIVKPSAPNDVCGPGGNMVTDNTECENAFVVAGLVTRRQYSCTNLEAYNMACLTGASIAAVCQCAPWLAYCTTAFCTIMDGGADGVNSLVCLNHSLSSNSEPAEISVVGRRVVCVYDECPDSGNDVRYGLETTVRGISIDPLSGAVSGVPVNAGSVKVVAALPMTENVTVWERYISFAEVEKVDHHLTDSTIAAIAVLVVVLLGLVAWLAIRLHAMRKRVFPLSYVKHIVELYNLPKTADLGKLIVPPSSVDTRRMENIGQGVSACVYKAKYKSGYCALKIAAPSTTVQNADDLVVAESLHLGGLDHPNVLKMYAITKINSRSTAVLQYCEFGSVLTNLRQGIGTQNAIVWAAGAADGLAYIHSSDIVHRDIAARNVLVDSNNVAKIADFALSRSVVGREYYRPSDPKKAAHLSIKWTDPALFLNDVQRYTKRHDIYSFGVFLSEIVANGTSPYPGMSGEQFFEYINTQFKRWKSTPTPKKPQMLFPNPVLDRVWEVASACWVQNRPIAADLSLQLHRIKAWQGCPSKFVDINTTDIDTTSL